MEFDVYCDSLQVCVEPSGAIRLGSDIVCDGFADGAPYRVQTHTHRDHMDGFAKSKGLQDIFCSPETKDLLIAELNAELAIRRNLIALSPSEWRELPTGRVRLLPSGHILGSVQVEVQLSDGQRLGYSGDFGWPVERVARVDQLVLDSTNGSPLSSRLYSFSEVALQLIDVVASSLRRGSVALIAHRGTLQRALEILDGELAVEYYCSEAIANEIGVYRRHGYSIPESVILAPSELKAAGRYIRLYTPGEHRQHSDETTTEVVLSAFGLADTRGPVLQYSKKSYRVALSAHADFEETLRYVEMTGAASVVVDNTRGGNGIELARAIREDLGIFAVPSTHQNFRTR